VDVSAIVLAGGRSTRFGRDKLAEPFDDGTVLTRTILAVGAVASDVVVVAGADSTLELPAGVRLARDHEPDGGPLVGVLAGLEAAAYERVVIVGGDMPWLLPAVLEMLVGAVGPGATAVALESDGRRQQLPIAVRRDPALETVRALTVSGQRRIGALLDGLDVTTIDEATWRVLDPDGATLRDIDTLEDLPPG
jgi:molybdopterin-guanine dinucleotide biosynthesis protein A